MKDYFVKIDNREEGPQTEKVIAQMFADGRVNRDTPCRPASGGDWKTIDDYLPMLKYGTQLPEPTSVVRSEDPPPYGYGAKGFRYDDKWIPPPQRVSLVDIDLPFVSILKIMFKWAAAGLIVSACIFPVLMIIVLVITAIFGSLLSGIFGAFHHP